MENKDTKFFKSDDVPDIDGLLQEYCSDDNVVAKADEAFDAASDANPTTAQTIVEPFATSTADALTAAPVAKKANPMEELAAMNENADEQPSDAEPSEEASTEESTLPPAPKRNGFMSFLLAIFPCVGDSAFDIVRKSIMVLGILVFIGAGTYLIDDLILIPQKNQVIADTLQEAYSPDAEPTLNEDELNFPYPEGMDSAFKKLYYQNPDVRGWISYHSTDGETINVEYPIMQAEDNDYYLFHDFYKAYNTNGTLFFDYRNDFSSQHARNRNSVIYGHNMNSGQMFAGLNNLLDGVDYARLAPTFKLNTLFDEAEYKVFAVMVVNNNQRDGLPFGYLRTEFTDNVDFATFLSEILARSMYVYGDVDLRPDDDIVMLSTCTVYRDVRFNDGRTVVVARRVREGEDPHTDVSQITDNTDVLMPYAWYTNRGLEPHPYYLDANYVIQPLDSLMQYLSTSTNANGQTTTMFPYYSQNGTYGLIASHTTQVTTTMPTTSMTLPSVDVVTTSPTPQTAAAYLQSFRVESTPAVYYVGDSFNFDQTYIVGYYSDGMRVTINPRHCAVEGFDSSRPGTCHVVVHYGSLRAGFTVTIRARTTTTVTTTRATTAPTTTTTQYVPPVTIPTTVPTEADPTAPFEVAEP